MIVTLVALAFQSSLVRGDYGVPIIRGRDLAQAMELQGYATAQDRFWQMEMSRRGARSKLAEVLGEKYVNADMEQAKSFYTDAELRAQFTKLPLSTQGWFQAYSRGVNRFIQEGNLPEEFAKNGYQPEPWTELDSAAITIKLLQTFGRGGAGELRNLALLKFLQSQPKIRDRALDIFDDLAWDNDPKSVPTVAPEDDPIKVKYQFRKPDRVSTEALLKQYPDLGVFDLLPGVRVVAREEVKRVAEQLKTPFKSGSYCVAVRGSKSKTGKALLLSGPQMGFTVPSIVHEVSLHAPKFDLAGMAIPGVPGVMIGATPDAAWGLTTGVADTEDITLLPLESMDEFSWSPVGSPTIHNVLQRTKFEIKVKGGEPRIFERLDTRHGQIVFQVKIKKTAFARLRAYEGRELQSYEAVSGLWFTKNRKDYDRATERATMNFNCFVALKNGDIGWKYLGLLPTHAVNRDARFPLLYEQSVTTLEPFLPEFQRPQAWNPKRGYLANWNNKPAEWWPNFDTPVWGEAFRNQHLLDQLTEKKLSVESLQNAVVKLATVEDLYPVFKSILAQTELKWWNGSLEEGQGSLLFDTFIDELRDDLFAPTIGNLGSKENFQLVVQPDVVLKALRGETKFDYLAGRKASEVIDSAMKTAISKVGDRRLKPSTLPVPAGIEPVSYRTRGTYLQIVEVGKSGMNIVTPGVATTGVHASDQAELARRFSFKPMVIE